MKTTATNPSRDFVQELDHSLETLSTRLSTVERELDLECANLRSLVNTNDPDIGRQLDSLGQSINDLHASLADVRQHLQIARENPLLADGDLSAEDVAIINEQRTKSSGVEKPDARQVASMRHDEPVTLSGILRALLMADEPEQRLTSKKL